MSGGVKLQLITSQTSESAPLLSYGKDVDDEKYTRAKVAAKKCIYKYIPITSWLPNYTCDSLLRDIIAGVTVGLMVVPQGLAYATIAGLPLQYGLYTAYMGCFIYCVFGGSKDVSIGPTAIMSLMVDHFAKGEPLYAIALTFYCGVAQLLLGALRLGFLVRFISLPGISGFVSAAAITIVFGQVKSLLGLKHIPREFIPKVIETFKHIKETNPWDLLLGSCCIVLLMILKKLNRIKWDDSESVTILQRVSRTFLWLASTARNALVVLLASFIVTAVESFPGMTDTFTLTMEVEARIPNFTVGVCPFFLSSLY